jgi:transcriptional regulator with XRE-family HTH domain
MNTVEKINLILKKTNISKVNLAKYLGVSRQMVYNYLDGNDLSKMPVEKCQLLFKLLEVKSSEEIDNKELTCEYLQRVSNKIFVNKKPTIKKDEVIELAGLKSEEQTLISDIVFILKEFLNEDKTKDSFTILSYLYHFLQAMGNTKELKYILGYVSKAAGYTKPTEYAFDEEHQFVFECIMYSAMTLYTNGGASKSKLIESHKRWEAELERKNEEKMSRTQELNTAKVQALKELGYTEINEKNASEVFDKIAEIQSRYV